MAPRKTLHFVWLALNVLRGVSVADHVGGSTIAAAAEFAADVEVDEETSVCLLQDATAFLHNSVVVHSHDDASDNDATQSGASAARHPHGALTSQAELGLKGTKSGKGFKQSVEEDEGTEAAPKTSSDITVKQIFVAVLILVPCVGFFTYCLSKLGLAKEEPMSPRAAADSEVRKNEHMEEDTYTFAVASLVRDAQRLSREDNKQLLFISRCMYSVTLLVCTIAVQAGLVLQVKWYVTPQQVAGIREAYDAYELHMYGGVESHTILNRNGKHRGIPEYFQPELFDTLDGDLQSAVCNIPMSRLTFFGMVLFVWSLTCISQIRKAWSLFWSLVVVTPTIGSMADCLIAADTDDEGDQGPALCPTASLRPSQQQYLYGENVVIVGLTAPVKAAVAMFVVLPWVGITGFLLWLGCRWLTATNDFGNLISNAVALEFILYLKDLTYLALVSERNKRELHNTKVLPDSRRERAGFLVYLGTLFWAVLTIVWLYAYIYHLQRVLPEYRWDVNAVCGHWFAELLARPA